MASYYYLLSSLPMLTASAPPPLGYDAFLEMCRSNVSPATYSALEELTVDSDRGALLKPWSRFYQRLREELRYQRMTRLGKSCQPPEDRDAAAAVQAAMAAENPLLGEQQLLELEFRQIDALIGFHVFDDVALFGYALKLKLLSRLYGFQFEAGKAEFKSLLDGIQQKIYRL